jgi:hypothetical protein
VALGLLLALALPQAEARASGPQMLDFGLIGGEGWRWLNSFEPRWVNQPGPEPAAVLYRRLDSNGTQVGQVVRSEDGPFLPSGISVPKPGAYTLEAWLESSTGEFGPRATATMRWDNVPPASAVPLAPPSWIAGDEEVVVRIAHPAAPFPISGIRGYAVSVDRGEGTLPCARAACAPAEIDLQGGIEDDTISLGALPEGINYIRAVAVSGAGLRSQQVSSAPLHVDATVPQVDWSGIPAGWAGGPVTVTAKATDLLSGMEAAGPEGPFTAIAVDGRPPAISLGDTASVVVSGEGVHEVAAFGRDAAGNVADGSGSSPMPSATPIRIDETPPRVGFASFQDPADPERIEVRVGDRLSGPSAERGSIAVRPAGSPAAFERLPTAVDAGRLIARWDSDAYPSGAYEFRAVGYDRAGNALATGLRLNGSRMVLGNPLKAPVTIESGFGGATMRWRSCRRSRAGVRCAARMLRSYDARPAEVALPFGRGIRFSGRAMSASGAPLAGAEIAIAETFAAEAVPARTVAHVITDATGAFSHRLPPGPSREVVASFAGDRLASRAVGRAVRLAVRSSLSFRASTSSARIGGPPVVFRGRVAAAATRIPPTGLPVELQFRYPGAGWSEFRTVQTDGAGRFHYAYAFSDDDSRGVRFQFRAHLAAADGWPYDPGSSRPVFVTGR